MLIVLAAFIPLANGVNEVIYQYLCYSLLLLLFCCSIVVVALKIHVNGLKLIHVMLINAAILNMLTLWLATVFTSFCSSAFSSVYSNDEQIIAKVFVLFPVFAVSLTAVSVLFYSFICNIRFCFRAPLLNTII